MAITLTPSTTSNYASVWLSPIECNANEMHYCCHCIIYCDRSKEVKSNAQSGHTNVTVSAAEGLHESHSSMTEVSLTLHNISPMSCTVLHPDIRGIILLDFIVFSLMQSL
jgi:hypothetical protein